MDFGDLGREMRALFGDLTEDLLEVEEANLRDLENEAHRASSGSLTYRDLARLDHPYARRRVRLNPNLVNRHRGEFDKGWRSEGPALHPDAFTSEMWNESAVAAFFVRGTDRMVARHPEDAAADLMEERRITRLERALARNLE